MNSKNIGKSLNKKLKDWCDSIDDEKVVKTIKENAIITGGSIVSLLNGEEPNDYDIYFKTYESALEVSEYYANKWNLNHDTKVHIVKDFDIHSLNCDKDIILENLEDNEENKEDVDKRIEEIENEIKKLQENSDRNIRISCYIKSEGIAVDENETAIDDNSEPYCEEIVSEEQGNVEKEKYRPRYFSTNAISLSDKIQLVIRFYGSVDEIHTNYDFVHCTCSYDFLTNNVNLPNKALEAIINKELFYTGSKYPLCSIIRTRKFIQRGWSINAGQYLKMCLQLNELDLKDFKTFQDQLVGVDSAYFEKVISDMYAKQSTDKYFKIDNNYLFEVINRIF